MPRMPLSPHLLSALEEEPAEGTAPSSCGRRDPAPGEAAVHDLDAPELLVVGALRAWVSPLARPGAPHPDWRELLRLAGVGAPGLLGLDALMALLAGRARRSLDVRCCRCPGLGGDEAAMLRLVSALQAGEALAALEVLGDWLPPEEAGPALRAASRFSAGVAAAGLTLAPRAPARPRILH